MKKCILIFAILATALLCSCRTIEIVQGERVRVIERDTITETVHDSIYIDRAGDTIYVKEWHTRWREKIVERHDTIDNTVQLPPEKYIPRFYKDCTVGFWVLLALWVIVIGLLILLRR